MICLPCFSLNLATAQRRGLQPDHPGAAYSSRPCFASEIQDRCPEKCIKMLGLRCKM